MQSNNRNNLRTFFDKEKSAQVSREDFLSILNGLPGKSKTPELVFSPYLKFAFAFAASSTAAFIFFFSFIKLGNEVQLLVTQATAPQAVMMNAKATSFGAEPRVMMVESQPVSPSAGDVKMESVVYGHVNQTEVKTGFLDSLMTWLSGLFNVFR